MCKRLYSGDFSFLPMPPVLSIKNQSKLPKSLLVGGQCLDRVMFCLKPFHFDDCSLKLTKYLMFPNNYFCKNLELSVPRKLKPYICDTNLPRALHNLVAVNQMVDKQVLKIVTLLLYSNKINSLHSEQVFYLIQLKTISALFQLPPRTISSAKFNGFKTEVYRFALPLPKYICTKLLHDFPGLPYVKDRLFSCASKSLGRIAQNP